MGHSLSPPLLSGLSGFVATRLGLHFPEERWTDLERGVVAAAREFGFPDTESCARWLLSASLTRTHFEVLASHLTVGETYFFREKESLQILEHQILPELLRSRAQGGRHLRIWSAGCATGEEPYSIAMLLDRLIGADTSWNVTILATDINPRFLRKAAEGVYGQWSFRGTPPSIRDRYFAKGNGNRFELHPDIRSKVTFFYLNLVDDVYPSLLNNTNAMDVIVCRNVLMYFTPERAREVAGKLHRSLIDGGWLIVSPTETSNTLFSSFSAVPFPGAVLYRNVEPVPVVPEPASFSFQVPLQPPEQEAGVPVASPLFEQREAEHVREDGHRHAERARRCANEGKLAEAMQWCERAIGADKLNPAHRYLLAIIQQEEGQTEAAVQSLTRALYLDPSFVLAHFGLANIELRLGRQCEARRHFANALAALQAHGREEILPESEGLTAGRLTEIIASVLASLPHAEAFVRSGPA